MYNTALSQVLIFVYGFMFHLCLLYFSPCNLPLLLKYTNIYLHIYYCIISQTLNQVLLSHVFFPSVCKFSEDKVTMPLKRQTQVTSMVNVVLEVYTGLIMSSQ